MNQTETLADKIRATVGWKVSWAADQAVGWAMDRMGPMEASEQACWVTHEAVREAVL